MEMQNEKAARAWVLEWQRAGGMPIGILKAAIAGLETCIGLTEQSPFMRSEYHAAQSYLHTVLVALEAQREQDDRDAERTKEAAQDLADARIARVLNGYRHW